MTMAISKAVEAGAQAVICASTGNTSAAAAAYAARAGIACIVLLPAGKIAFGKLAQAFMYGAKVVAIDGNFDDALRLVREIGETEPIAIVNSINPVPSRRAEDRGLRDHRRRSATRRTCTSCPSATPATSAPTGWATTSSTASAKPRSCPKMAGFQAAGSAPIFYDKVVEKPGDRRHRDPHRQSRELGTRHRRDRATPAARSTSSPTRKFSPRNSWLAANEGIFVEPASAASIAGLFKCLGANAGAACPLPAHRPRAARSSAPSPATA